MTIALGHARGDDVEWWLLCLQIFTESGGFHPCLHEEDTIPVPCSSCNVDTQGVGSTGELLPQCTHATLFSRIRLAVLTLKGGRIHSGNLIECNTHGSTGTLTRLILSVPNQQDLLRSRLSCSPRVTVVTGTTCAISCTRYIGSNHGPRGGVRYGTSEYYCC